MKGPSYRCFRSFRPQVTGNSQCVYLLSGLHVIKLDAAVLSQAARVDGTVIYAEQEPVVGLSNSRNPRHFEIFEGVRKKCIRRANY